MTLLHGIAKSSSVNWNKYLASGIYLGSKAIAAKNKKLLAHRHYDCISINKMTSASVYTNNIKLFVDGCVIGVIAIRKYTCKR